MKKVRGGIQSPVNQDRKQSKTEASGENGQLTKENQSILKINKSWLWWCTPIVPADPEAEAGGSTESRSSRL